MLKRLRQSRSFFQKQLFTVIGINVLSLGIVAGVLYSSYVDNYKDDLINVMQSKVTLLASTSGSALLFDDDVAATRVLGTLAQYPATRYAQMFDLEKNLFAQYKREGERIDIQLSKLKPGSFFLQGNFYLAQPIVLDGEEVGSIVVSADTKSLQAQQSRYAATVLGVFLISLFLAYILNWRMQKLLTAPLRELVGLTARVAESREYSGRLQVRSKDEIGVLGHGVNSMLDTIEKHEIQLKENSQRLESLVQQLYDRAHYDELTRLPNRHLLTDRVSHSIEISRRAKSRTALLFLDLDRFKVINDSLGHPLGDKVLERVAGKLRGIVRRADSIFRWGGDEFVILLEGIRDADDVRLVAKKIVSELSNPLEIQGHQLHVSTCIGIATYPDDGSSAEVLLKHADISMYKAKERGPGHYCFFDDEMLTDSVARLSQETRVRRALEQGELFLVYQPQVSIDGATLKGLEALVRWEDEGQMVSPELFLPVIEEIGLMHEFSLWVLRTACAQNFHWQALGLPKVRVAVNLPVSFIMHPQCVRSVANILQETGLRPEYLEVEITENTFMSSTSYAVQVLKELKSMGVSISIDDFGTGYSCMSYLRDLPIGSLKIDGSFVQDLGVNRKNDGIVESIITLGKSLDLVVIGECVETPSQLEILRTMQCDVIQGHYYSKPLRVSEAQNYLRAQAIALSVRETLPQTSDTRHFHGFPRSLGMEGSD